LRSASAARLGNRLKLRSVWRSPGRARAWAQRCCAEHCKRPAFAASGFCTWRAMPRTAECNSSRASSTPNCPSTSAASSARSSVGDARVVIAAGLTDQNGKPKYTACTHSGTSIPVGASTGARTAVSNYWRSWCRSGSGHASIVMNGRRRQGAAELASIG
jgi:hypothetical protein